MQGKQMPAQCGVVPTCGKAFISVSSKEEPEELEDGGAAGTGGVTGNVRGPSRSSIFFRAHPG